MRRGGDKCGYNDVSGGGCEIKSELIELRKEW